MQKIESYAPAQAQQAKNSISIPPAGPLPPTIGLSAEQNERPVQVVEANQPHPRIVQYPPADPPYIPPAGWNPTPVIPFLNDGVRVATEQMLPGERKLAVPPHIPPAGWNPTHSIDLALEDIANKRPKEQLKDSEMPKDALKSRSVLEQNVIQMIKEGAAPADIKRVFNLSTEESAAILESYRTALADKLRKMLQSGMTEAQVREAEKDNLKSALLNASNTMTPADSSGLAPETTSLPSASLEQQRPNKKAEKTPRQRKPRTLGEVAAQSVFDLSPAQEGGRKQKTHYSKVRSAKLRKAAIEIHGRDCCACTKNFDEIYGPELAKGYVEIHHLNKIAAGERTTDPATDLAPLCSNCHTMADRLSPPPRTIAELRYRLFPEFRFQEKEAVPAVKANKSPVKTRITKVRENKPKKSS